MLEGLLPLLARLAAPCCNNPEHANWSKNTRITSEELALLQAFNAIPPVSAPAAPARRNAQYDGAKHPVAESRSEQANSAPAGTEPLADRWERIKSGTWLRGEQDEVTDYVERLQIRIRNLEVLRAGDDQTIRALTVQLEQARESGRNDVRDRETWQRAQESMEFQWASVPGEGGPEFTPYEPASGKDTTEKSERKEIDDPPL